MKALALCLLLLGCGPDVETEPQKEPTSCYDFIKLCRDAFGADAYALWCPGQPREGEAQWTPGAWCIVPEPPQ